MKIIRDTDGLKEIDNADMATLITQRMAEMSDGEAFDPDIHGHFVVIYPGDGIAEIEREVGAIHLVEIIEEHATFFELVFIGSGDFGIVVLVPNSEGIDAELIDFCQSHAGAIP